MVRLIQFLTRLSFLCILWVLTRSLQFIFEISMLDRETGYTSGAEMELQVKIIAMLRRAVPERLKV
ncbi:MAG: hypothetical protein AAF959_11805 [Cyanobacteria bacterium P01_D01_bin.56]